MKNVTNKEFADSLKQLVGTDNIDYGERNAIIRKVALSRIDSTGWFVEFEDTGKSEWVLNEAPECYIPEGRVQNNLVFPTEEVKVRISKKYRAGFNVITRYVGQNYDSFIGCRVISKGNGLLVLSDDIIYIKLMNSEVKIAEDRIDINANEVYINGTKV